MSTDQKAALIEYVLGLADDEMLLAHRNSEWTGHAPILEEDIAFTNIALDEMGHASLWYRLVAQLSGENEEHYPDNLVFLRTAQEFRNVQLVELPNGDWAFSMLRQYLFDAMESTRLSFLVQSEHTPIRDTAGKIQREEIYHYRHTSAWVRRLGLGTEESNDRMQQALNGLWGYALQLSESHSTSELAPDGNALRESWEGLVRPHLAQSELDVPEAAAAVATRRSDHTEHIIELVNEMQEVARLEANVNW
jgi:ring-1,2-phenylacetyl-CoA epoxidase subunit PaaC